MKSKKVKVFFCLFLAFSIGGEDELFGQGFSKIRVGHFSTVTHAPALVGRAQGRFEKEFENVASIEWKIFNAGSLAIEALFAGEIDILYTGPNPAVNGFVRSRGEALRIVAGVASGGSAFVVREGSGIERFEDIRGKRVAIPQIGNSQDVALRHLMKEKKLKARSEGGDIDLFRIAGGDQITVMSKGEVDGIWAVEPWVSRLVAEAHGKILFEEAELWPDGRYATALLIVRKQFLDVHPDWVRKWVQAHRQMVEWINTHSEEAKELLNGELERETGHRLPDIYLDRCFQRVIFTIDPMEGAVKQAAERAFEIGFLGKNWVSLASLYDLSFVKED